MIAALLFAGADPPDTRQPVWAIRLDRLVKEPHGWAEGARHETRAVAFSPDDKRIAVTLTHDSNTHLLVVEVDSPEATVRQFDLTSTCGVDLTWNERGDTILVCGTLLRLVDGASCAVNRPSLSREFGPNRAYWLDSDHIVRGNGEIFDLNCQQAGDWHVPPAWRIEAVAASKGWALLRHNTSCLYSIMDSASHRALPGWPVRNPPGMCGLGTLAVGAEAMCANVFTGNPRLHCWLLNGAAEIVVPKQFRGYQMSQAVALSALVTADKWEHYHDPWWELLLTWWVPVDAPVILRSRAVFNLRSGEVIASWKPRVQNTTSPHIEDWPYQCALSAHGE